MMPREDRYESANAEFTPPAGEGSMIKAHREQEALLDRLDTAFQLLAARLQPIVCNFPQAAGPVAAETTPNMCPVAETITGNNARLQRLLREIESLTEMVDI